MFRWTNVINRRFSMEPIINLPAFRTQFYSSTEVYGQPKLSEQNYENAIYTLNTLQSNFSVLEDSIKRKHDNDSRHITDTLKFLGRIGIHSDNLGKLPAIHISGTKGKGSTCAMVESILRRHGYRTGFYSSPHLISVTERVRLNGIPISIEKFTNNFWRIYNQLASSREHSHDLPSYFGFLTIMAIDVFLKEEVDVCVVEVGIGGRYDCTNVLQNTGTVGITSLGLEHTKLLGSTLKEIAWQKAGIIKSGSNVFTVQQPEQCIEVIENECLKMKAKLCLVPSTLQAYHWEDETLPIEGNCNIVEVNTSLAIQIASNWIRNTRPGVLPSMDSLFVTKDIAKGIEHCFWPGRLQRILCGNQQTLFLDGAHTVESIEVCARWFYTMSKSQHKRLLIFNTTGDRDSSALLTVVSSILKFDKVFFVPNVAISSGTRADAINNNFPLKQQLQRCQQNYNFWVAQLENEKAYLHTSIESVFKQIDNEFSCIEEPCDILVTGSIHLIGATMTALKMEKYVCPSDADFNA